MPLTESDIEQIRGAIAHWSRTGQPEHAYRLRDHLEAGTMPPANLISMGKVKPEKTISVPLDSIVPPPRTGKGSGKAAWQEFVLSTCDIEPEVVNRMSRDDLINVAIAKGVISKLEEAEDE